MEPQAPLRFATALAFCLALGALLLGCARPAVQGQVRRAAEAFGHRDDQKACDLMSDEGKRNLMARLRPAITCEAAVASLDPASVEACRNARVREVRVVSSEDAWARVEAPSGDTQVFLSKAPNRDWLLDTPPCGRTTLR
jgi:hypothetical protein